MAFTVDSYPCRGIVVPQAYFKILSFSGSKEAGYSAFFGVFASKELADKKAGHIIDHINIHCDYEADADVWTLMYEKAKTLDHFKGMTLTNC